MLRTSLLNSPPVKEEPILLGLLATVAYPPSRFVKTGLKYRVLPLTGSRTDVLGTSGRGKPQSMPARFLLTTRLRQVYIIDKVENNPMQVNGHPARAVGASTTSKS